MGKLSIFITVLCLWRYTLLVHAKGCSSSDLIITGVLDGPLAGGTPKLIELYALNDVSDLRIYKVGSANNGGLSVMEPPSLSGSASAGQFIYVTQNSSWADPPYTDGTEAFFGSTPLSSIPNFMSSAFRSAPNINGNDAVELFLNDLAVDVFGVVGEDPEGDPPKPWFHRDGWVYRKNSGCPRTDFKLTRDWDFSGANALVGYQSNADASAAGVGFPIGSFTNDEDEQ